MRFSKFNESVICYYEVSFPNEGQPEMPQKFHTSSATIVKKWDLHQWAKLCTNSRLYSVKCLFSKYIWSKFPSKFSKILRLTESK